MATNLRNTIFSTLPEHTLSQETYTPKYGFILIAEGTLQIDFVTATHAAIYTVLPISLVVLGTGTGTYVVLKYIFQVLVLVLVLAYKVLVSHLGISPRMAFQGSVSGRPRANQN